MKSSLAFGVIFLLTVCSSVAVNGEIERIESDVDEGSCICGLNKEILDRLEHIINLAAGSSPRTCDANSAPQNQTGESAGDDDKVEDSDEKKDEDEDVTPPDTTEVEDKEEVEKSEAQSGESPATGTILDNLAAGQSKKPNGALSSNAVLINFIIELTKDIHELEQQVKDLRKDKDKEKQEEAAHAKTPTKDDEHEKPAESDKDHSEETTKSDDGSGNKENKGDGDHDEEEKPAESVHSADQIQGHSSMVNGGFLAGVHGQIEKPNSSSELSPETVQSAVQSTVPNVVSNIFTNIQNLTQAAESDSPIQGTSDGTSNNLVSIDGNFINTTGESTESILADGERLFIAWLERQLEALHLSASMANYIRKSSMNLFRRIMKQYIDQVSKLSGGLQNNVRRATQMALSNTQNLVAYILKHYVNFAGGMMQIIGEQVSRVGKQLDTTGETIAHISLNPFDIVSNVMESLPNPSDYSKYFRAFGKQLMGNISSAINGTHESTTEEPGADQQGTNNKGLIRRTMGALGKTLGSWMG